jgi:hypothetical protein
VATTDTQAPTLAQTTDAPDPKFERISGTTSTEAKASTDHTTATCRSILMSATRVPRLRFHITHKAPHPPMAQIMSAFHQVSLWSVAMAINANNKAIAADTTAVTSIDTCLPTRRHRDAFAAKRQDTKVQSAHPHMSQTGAFRPESPCGKPAW